MIKPKKIFFRSKVAYRMLAFFMLATFVPVSFLAYLTYSESNDMLLKKAQHELAAASDSFNKIVYDRLLLAEQQIQNAILQHDNGLRTVKSEMFQGERVRNLTLLQPGSGVKRVFGELQRIETLNEKELKHLSSGRSLIKTQFHESESKILLLSLLYPSAPERGILIADIMPEYLWGAETLPLHIGLCVTNEQYERLFCAHQPKGVLFEQRLKHAALQSKKGEFSWTYDNIVYIANYYEIFLEAHFLTSRWLVIAMQPKKEALGNMTRFSTIFWGGVMLSVLVILLFSMVQIRRILGPLEKLIESTRRLGGQDFSVQVDIVSKDEFGELASSFNQMTTQLGMQFNTMNALSRIDREILSELDIDKIVNDTLMHLSTSIEADFSGISVLNPDTPNQAVFYLLESQTKRVCTNNFDLSGNIEKLTEVSTEGVWLDRQMIQKISEFDEIDSSLTDLSCLFVLPLQWKEQVVGFIALGFREPTIWSQSNRQSIQDFSDRIAVALFTKNREELLLRQARIDALTHLPNRFLFMEQLQKSIAQSQRNGQKLAVLYIDLDRFKMINDSYGHSTGDTLLREVGERLRGCVFEGDTVARLGGDEFAVIISELFAERVAQMVAEKIIAVLSRTFMIQGEKNVLAASIGIALYPNDGLNIADLVRNADIAMYRAKEKGGNQYIFFEESMNIVINERAVIERGLRQAVSEQQFIIYYQPQVEPKSGLVQGAETLIRWHHPELGFVSPDTFIPIAEDTGLIVDIGRFILSSACAQMRAWLNEGAQLEYIAVNVSVKQFQQVDFFHMVEQVLKDHNLQPYYLELEITESVLMDDTEVMLSMLEQFKHLGVRLSIDDFGTGYSSMSYLEQLPFDTIKIDKSFVSKIGEDGKGGTIAASIAAMAHALDKTIVAEGAEIQAQVDFLIECDCELVQGYYYSAPILADEFLVYVKSNHASTLTAKSGRPDHSAESVSEPSDISA